MRPALCVVFVFLMTGCGGSAAQRNGIISAPQRADDVSAQSDARNLAGFVEACFAETADYRACTTGAGLGQSGLSLGTGPGQVSVAAPDAAHYVVTARSRSGATFTVSK
jgi:hypothetical protein